MKQLILFFTLFFIFFPQIDSSATETPSPIIKLKERIESIDESLRNVVSNFQNSPNLEALYKYQVEDINTLLKITITNVNKKLKSVKKEDGRIQECFNSVRKEIYSMNQTAFTETKQCQKYAFIPVSKQIQSGLMMGKHLMAELDKLAYQCREGPKMMETYCVAKKVPSIIHCMKSYRSLAGQLKEKMEDYVSLLEISVKKCFEDTQMTLQKSSKDAETSAKICTVF